MSFHLDHDFLGLRLARDGALEILYESPETGRLLLRANSISLDLDRLERAIRSACGRPGGIRQLSEALDRSAMPVQLVGAQAAA